MIKKITTPKDQFPKKNDKIITSSNSDENKKNVNENNNSTKIKIVGIVDLPANPSEHSAVAMARILAEQMKRKKEFSKIITAISETRYPQEFKECLTKIVTDFYEEYYGDKYNVKKQEYSTTLKTMDYVDYSVDKEEKIREIETAVEELAVRIKQRFQHGIAVIKYDEDLEEKTLRVNTEKISEIISALERVIMKSAKIRIFNKEIEFDDFSEFLKETPIEKFAEIYKKISELRRRI